MARKRVLAIHDISCFGRCSLTVALPIISSTGAECTAMPTAVLSTHTGGFTGYTYRDLTDDLIPILEHWKTLGLRFDSIYTGFLGSFEQIDIVSKIFDELKEKDTVIVVDPVMADNGELYPIFDKDFPKGMKKLCKKADVMIPNITEAALLLGEEYKNGPYSEEYIEGLLKRLGKINSKKIILTGVFFNEKHLGAAAYDVKTGEISYSFHELIPGYYHGTGDVFGSVVVSALMNGSDLKKANDLAVKFTAECIVRTRASGADVRFGVDFEEGLCELAEQVRKKD
ncbi:MAG: pyridoxamine kinase [Methanomassiliicoccaceae archaeon]|nr:pyridoxamine kinase [Methanomassiliicoccaceae archaeon]